jgi:ubiquinone/menaquinone biosynthesis C-methylase UbiE
MSQTIRFDPHRFQTAARHYLAGRPPYAPQLMRRVAQLCDLRGTDRVMDLGCGPGQLARAFAALAAEVVAIDPEPEMLRIAAEASPGIGNIAWHRGSSYDLPGDFGRFRLVCMGRSFHWMDRPETLRRLDGMIEPGGAVALFHDTHPDVPDNAWLADYRALLQRYAEAVRDHWRGPGWLRHEVMLMDSAFPRIEQIGVMERHEVSADTLIERALSMSSTSRSRLGDARAGEMVADLRALLPAAGVREVVMSMAMLAWRQPVG